MNTVTLRTGQGVSCSVHFPKEPLRAMECLRCGERKGYMVGHQVKHRCGKPREVFSQETISIHLFTSGPDREQWLEGEPMETPTHWPPTEETQ